MRSVHSRMPIFYFDIYDNGEFLPDEEGVVCADLEAVKREATRALAEMAVGRLPGRERYLLSIQVRDPDRQAILQTSLAFEAALS